MRGRLQEFRPSCLSPRTFLKKQMEKAKQCLTYLVSMLVDNHEAVEINGRTDELGVLLTLRVAKEDMGRVIGRNGDIAKAIRSLLRVVGMKEGARINLKIDEPNV